MNPLGIQRFADPKTVITHFHLREGDTVGDFGAGSGFFVELLSKEVGSNGRVYACEIQKELVEKIGALARKNGLSNVYPLWCDFEDVKGAKIADGALDVALMINTLFQLEHKENALSEISRTLRPGGKFFLIDWTDSFGGLGPQPEDVFSENDARSLSEQKGFTFERSFDAGDHHYGLAFRKA